MDLRFAPARPVGLSGSARIAFVLILAALAPTTGLLAAGCGSSAGSAAPEPMMTGSSAVIESRLASVASAATVPGAATAGASPSQSLASPTGSSTTTTTAAGRVVAAAAVVRRFCRLVDQHRYAAARRLLTEPSVWPLHELRAVRRLRFESVQAWGEPADDELTLLVTFTAAVSWRSPLTDGLNDVFFTLTRRVTQGEWLIAAVSTSP
jgi:hypothetical protein